MQNNAKLYKSNMIPFEKFPNIYNYYLHIKAQTAGLQI